MKVLLLSIGAVGLLLAAVLLIGEWAYQESLAERIGHGDCVLANHSECVWLPYPHRVWAPVR